MFDLIFRHVTAAGAHLASPKDGPFQTRSDSVNLGSNPGPPARWSGLRGDISRWGRIRDCAGVVNEPRHNPMLCSCSIGTATVLPQIRKDHRIVGADNLRPHKRVAIEPHFAH